jgi:hypothetical protein
MSRKIFIAIAAAATVAVASLAPSTATYARGGSFHMGGAHFARAGSFHFAARSIASHRSFANFHRPIRVVHPFHPGHLKFSHLHFHHHRWVFRGGRWMVLDGEVDPGVDEAPAPVSAAATPAPGPCTCLTKTYTQSGLVVFADVCTKESASAPADGTTQGEATQVPTSPVAANQVPMSVVPTKPNYAGQTYEDYLAVNPQAGNPQGPAKN